MKHVRLVGGARPEGFTYETKVDGIVFLTESGRGDGDRSQMGKGTYHELPNVLLPFCSARR